MKHEEDNTQLMFCCGEHKNLRNSYTAKNYKLFEKATTAIIECILKIQFDDRNLTDFTVLEDSPDSPFAKFIATAFTSDQRELIEDLKLLFFKRLHEDKALKVQEDAAFSDASIPADAGAYIADMMKFKLPWKFVDTKF